MVSLGAFARFLAFVLVNHKIVDGFAVVVAPKACIDAVRSAVVKPLSKKTKTKTKTKKRKRNKKNKTTDTGPDVHDSNNTSSSNRENGQHDRTSILKNSEETVT